MKTEMTTYECAKALTHDEYASWTRAGAFALIEYLEQLEEDCEMSIEFDPVAIRGDYSEYESLIDFAEENFMNYREEFGIEYENPMTGEIKDQSVTDCDGNLHDEVLDSIKEYIQDNGVLIEFDGGIIAHESNPFG